MEKTALKIDGQDRLPVAGLDAFWVRRFAFHFGQGMPCGFLF